MTKKPAKTKAEMHAIVKNPTAARLFKDYTRETSTVEKGRIRGEINDALGMTLTKDSVRKYAKITEHMREGHIEVGYIIPYSSHTFNVTFRSPTFDEQLRRSYSILGIRGAWT
jgi:hypothetical protein